MIKFLFLFAAFIVQINDSCMNFSIKCMIAIDMFAGKCSHIDWLTADNDREKNNVNVYKHFFLYNLRYLYIYINIIIFHLRAGVLCLASTRRSRTETRKLFIEASKSVTKSCECKICTRNWKFWAEWTRRVVISVVYSFACERRAGDYLRSYPHVARPSGDSA